MRSKGILGFFLSLALLTGHASEQLRVVATVPELGALAEALLGPEAVITVLVKPREDPHFIEARPSFIPALRRADLLLAVGLDLEVGWLPSLVRGARRPELNDANVGLLTVESVIEPLGVPTGPVDRSGGDVHAHGNPHALCDPANGWLVAKAIAWRIAARRPDLADHLTARRDAFAIVLAQAWFGHELPAAQARALLDSRDHAAWLANAGLEPGGWMATMQPIQGQQFIADHDLWPYAARRFGFNVVGFLEPKPGLPPSQAHLAHIIARMQAENVRSILTVPNQDRRHAERVATATSARIIDLPHQAGAVPGSEGYVAWINEIVRRLSQP